MGGFATGRLKKRFRVKSSKAGRFDCLRRMVFRMRKEGVSKKITGKPPKFLRRRSVGRANEKCG